MPGIGVRTGARILIDVGDGSTFPTAAHLAAYAGLAPATRSSGSSIRGEQPSRRGNKQLKRAFFLVRVRRPGRPGLPRLLRQEDRARANTTPKPSSASPDDEPTSSSRCSATAPSTNPNPPHRLDETHRGTFSRARMFTESIAHRDQSSSPRAPSSSRTRRCSLAHTRAFDSTRANRRWAVGRTARTTRRQLPPRASRRGHEHDRGQHLTVPVPAAGHHPAAATAPPAPPAGTTPTTHPAPDAPRSPSRTQRLPITPNETIV